LESVNAASASLAATLDAAQPAAEQLSQTTIPAAEATMRDLEATSRALRKVTERLESQGAAAVIGGQTLPDYEP